VTFNDVESTRSDAWENNLPPIGFSVDKTGTGMIVERFPEDNCYLKLIRPPGAVFELAVYTFKGSSFDHADLDDHIRRLYSDERLRFGKRINIDLDNVSRIGRIFLTGEGRSQRIRFACVVPSPNGGPFGLMLVYGKYSNKRRLPNSIREIIDDNQLSLLESFVVSGSR
jgi:hypothetical protein